MLTAMIRTTYTAEYFYPSYYKSVRPTPSGLPKTISYGGVAFDITLPASSYSGSSNTAASSAKVVLLRPGWTTHAMNMGQRYMQLNNTYTVNQDGSIVLHTAQAAPNANLFQPGPALLFVVVNDIPSKGSMVILGNGAIGAQTIADVAILPASVNTTSTGAKGSATSTAVNSTGSSNTTGADQSSSTSGALTLVPHAFGSLLVAFLVALTL
jgi:hypothetical protein